MNIRALGATGIRVGEIGMGCEGFIGKTRQEVREFLDVMERSGANLIDLYSPDPEMRSALGEAIARPAGQLCAPGAFVHDLERRAVRAHPRYRGGASEL